MWNRSYHWQFLVRLWVGAFTLATLVVLCIVSRSAPAVQNATESLGNLARSVAGTGTFLARCQVPTALDVKPGHIVHQSQGDGLPHIVGRVVAVNPLPDESLVEIEIQLAESVVSELKMGGTIKGAPTVIGLENAMRLIISPEAPHDEALRAKDALWPTVEKEIIPGLTDNVVREVRELFAQLNDDDRALVLEALDELRTELSPLEEELVSRLSNRAWKEVGVGGVAGGIWRLAVAGLGNKRKDVRDWFRLRMGSKAIGDRKQAEFLEQETRSALRKALVDEFQAFWKDHKAEILEKTEGVLGRRKADFAKTLREKWVPTLFKNAVAPAWLAGEDKVIRAVESYAEDFTNRRLVSSSGGPRLVFAHALRGVLGISEAPLLIIEARDDGQPGELQYQPVAP